MFQGFHITFKATNNCVYFYVRSLFGVNYPNDRLTLNFFLMKVILAGASDKIEFSLQSVTFSSGFLIVALITGLNLHKPAAFLEVFVLLPVKPD